MLHFVCPNSKWAPPAPILEQRKTTLSLSSSSSILLYWVKTFDTILFRDSFTYMCPRTHIYTHLYKIDVSPFFEYFHNYDSWPQYLVWTWREIIFYLMHFQNSIDTSQTTLKLILSPISPVHINFFPNPNYLNTLRLWIFKILGRT